ncbi:MAG: NupC/NupG family nucleoside CNT transporter [Cellvibrionaceae bacterium]|nr:NupC/NupG family nucleoside CNT transporter [Cellvibrionaceae bacterium]
MSLLGILSLLCIAFGLSSHRRQVNWHTVGAAFALQFALGAFALYLPQGKVVLNHASLGVSRVLSYANDGINFLFGDIGQQKLGFIFAFNVLPVIIFFSALVSVLYYLGIMTWIIRILGGALQKLLKTSRAESLSATANIFVSQTEAPVVIRPYLASMSRSELFAVMVGGMATVAGSILAGYVGLGVELKYLLAASFMAAPGGFLMAKLLVPETRDIAARQHSVVSAEQYVNIFDAAASGASNGMKLAVNIGAMLLAFIALIALLNGLLGWLGSLVGYPNLSLQNLLGLCFQPIAFMVGIPWQESAIAGSLIGQKLVLNEFVAFVDFASVKPGLSEHSRAVVTFALCGFANFSSIAILLGGIGTMAPQRRSDLAQLGLRAVLAAFMANLMSAAIASFFLSLSPAFAAA